MEYYNEILEFINNYKSQTFIYPRVIKRRFNMSSLAVYEVLDVLVNKGILKRVYGLYCNNCNTIDDIIYESLNQIHDNAFCSNCRSEFNISEETILYYKKN